MILAVLCVLNRQVSLSLHTHVGSDNWTHVRQQLIQIFIEISSGNRTIEDGSDHAFQTSPNISLFDAETFVLVILFPKSSGSIFFSKTVVSEQQKACEQNWLNPGQKLWPVVRFFLYSTWRNRENLMLCFGP